MYFSGIDWLRGIAAFFIVGCHIGLLERTAAGTAVTHFCDLNVGIFAAISGFLFAQSCIGRVDIDTKGILSKRVKRLLPLYVVWSVAYLIVRLGCGGGLAKESEAGIRFFVWLIFGGGAACTLWFLINLLYATVFICAVLLVFPSLLNKWWFTLLLSCGMLYWSIVDTGYLGYYSARLFAFVFLGWSLALCKSALPKNAWFWLGVSMCCLVAHFVFSNTIHRFMRDFICAIPILMFFVAPIFKKTTKTGRLLSSASLWHPLFAVIVQRIVTKMLNVPYSAYIVLMAWIVVYSLALAATLVANKTFLRRFQT